MDPKLRTAALEYAITKVQARREGVGHTHHFLIYADDVNILSENIHAKTKNTEAAAVATKEAGL